MDLNGALKVLREKRNVYVTVFSKDIEVPFTLPTNQDARRYNFLLQASQATAHSRIYLEIFQRYCCDKELVASDLPAGIGETVAKLILWMSGYGREPLEYTQQLIEENRKEVESISKVIKRTICSVFKGYTFADLEELDFPDLLELFVHSEKVLLEAGIIGGEFQIGDTQKGQSKIDINAVINDQRKGLAQVDARR